MPSSEESQWVIDIRRALEEDFETYEDLPVSVSDVPKQLLCSKPEAYTPQFVALGPYHHRRDDLHDMERYKLFAIKRTQGQLQSISLQHLVDLFAKLEFAIRAHYRRYLNITGETLAWMMALDASFLLEFLQIYAAADDYKILRRIPSRMSHLVDTAWRKSSHDMLLRDLVMLENQIPLFIPRRILEFQCSSIEATDELLSRMLVGFLKEVSPFRMSESFRCIEFSRHSHLLEFLYHKIVPRLEEPLELIEEDGNVGQSGNNSSCMQQGIHLIRNFIPCVIKFLLKIPWKIFKNIPAFWIIKHSVEHLFLQMDQNLKPNNERTLSPLLEEIAIPSVSELAYAGITFTPTYGDLSTIKFVAKTATLHLPAISLDVNSEVVLRNLVAYEASIVSGPLVFTRYVELMNGIIDSEEDVVALREGGVVSNGLKSDGEVAELWNGMSRSVRLSKAPAIDGVIEDVNKYYNSRWRVKVGRVVRRYVDGSWEPFRFVAVVLLLVVMSLQAVCAVYGCARWSHGR